MTVITLFDLTLRSLRSLPSLQWIKDNFQSEWRNRFRTSIAGSSPPAIWQHQSVPSLAAEFRDKSLESSEERFRAFPFANRFAKRTEFASFLIRIIFVNRVVFAPYAILAHAAKGATSIQIRIHFAAFSAIELGLQLFRFCVHTLQIRLCSCSQTRWPGKGYSEKDCEEK